MAAAKLNWHPIVGGGKSLDESLAKYARRTKIAEGWHLGTAAFIGFISWGLLRGGHYDVGTFAIVLNGIVNAYPIMLQRFNRSRVIGLIERRDGRVGPAYTPMQRPVGFAGRC